MRTERKQIRRSFILLLELRRVGVGLPGDDDVPIGNTNRQGEFGNGVVRIRAGRILSQVVMVWFMQTVIVDASGLCLNPI